MENQMEHNMENKWKPGIYSDLTFPMLRGTILGGAGQ